MGLPRWPRAHSAWRLITHSCHQTHASLPMVPSSLSFSVPLSSLCSSLPSSLALPLPHPHVWPSLSSCETVCIISPAAQTGLLLLPLPQRRGWACPVHQPPQGWRPHCPVLAARLELPKETLSSGPGFLGKPSGTWADCSVALVAGSLPCRPGCLPEIVMHPQP